ncbi:beta-lactamase family protein [Ophiocordyceps camponoti-floridani]|uniref:Actin-like protein ARP6 n=1 Tax=Ophiocordyceps camponoti-floridani TaxID=2030778 RepID=A0A8H4Q8Y3_9HYPO|nr:beta-lactamase family protein [Ophiocordyceps camponoti-floridani]
MAGGRKSQGTSTASPPAQTLVVDNGAYSLKAGLVSDGSVIDDVKVVPNCVARDRARAVYVGSDLDRCRDFGEMQFRRPVEKGFIVNWEMQREIWHHELLDSCDAKETRLVLAEPPNGLPALQANCDQMVFEEFGFASYFRGVGPVFNAYHDIQSFFQTVRDAPTVPAAPAEVLLVIDSGYSHTTITPVLRGRPLNSAVRRLDVGGKVLTNYLARLVSLRHLDMRNDTHIVNEIKEAACYVSLDFTADLEKCWKGTRGGRRPEYQFAGGIVKDYVLPDFHTRPNGFLRDHDPARHPKAGRMAADEDVVTLRNERFAVPELLFNPSDVGIRQPGIADLVMQSLHQLPVGLWPALLANILVVGGNSLFEGFVQRLEQEVRLRAPDSCIVRVARSPDPVTSTWRGAANMANHADMEAVAVTKQEYEELGVALVARRFATGIVVPP